MGVTLGEAVRTLLVADSAVLALVGQRITPLVLPQTEVLPAVTYQEISTAPYNQLGGRSKASQVRLQVNVFAKSYQEAFNISKAILDVLESYSGVSAALQINYISYAGKRDLYEEDSRLYHIASDYSILVINS